MDGVGQEEREGEGLLLSEFSEKPKGKVWMVLSIFLLIALITIVILYALGVGWKEKKEEENFESILSLWEENSSLKKQLF